MRDPWTIEDLAAAARSAAVLLRSTADEAGGPRRWIDPAVLRSAARGLDEIAAAASRGRAVNRAAYVHYDHLARGWVLEVTGDGSRHAFPKGPVPPSAPRRAQVLRELGWAVAGGWTWREDRRTADTSVLTGTAAVGRVLPAGVVPLAAPLGRVDSGAPFIEERG